MSFIVAASRISGRMTMKRLPAMAARTVVRMARMKIVMNASSVRLRGQKTDIVVIDCQLPDGDNTVCGFVGHFAGRGGCILNDVAAGRLDDVQLARGILDLDHADHGVGDEGAGNLIYGVVVEIP